jgi:preprotein translocase SecE subunit
MILEIAQKGVFLKPITMNSLIKYLRDTSAELRQVKWPTQEQALFYTALVVVISFLVSLYIGAFDYLFSQAMNFIINTF